MVRLCARALVSLAICGCASPGVRPLAPPLPQSVPESRLGHESAERVSASVSAADSAVTAPSSPLRVLEHGGARAYADQFARPEACEKGARAILDRSRDD